MSPVVAYLASLESPRSRRTMATALKGLAALVGEENPVDLRWENMSAAEATGLRGLLADRVQRGELAPATARLWVVALRGVLRQGLLLDLVGHEQLAKLNAALRPIRGSRVRSGRALDRREIRRLFGACAMQKEPTRSRNLAVLALAIVGGLRRAELVNLDLADWEPQQRALCVMGKGQRERRVMLGRQAADYVDGWVRLRGGHGGALVHPVRADGTIVVRRCSEQAVYRVLDHLSRRAGLEPVRPHDCRRTMISAMLDEQIDLLTIMRQSGHRSAAVVEGYDLRPERAQRAAVEQVYCPLVER